MEDFEYQGDMLELEADIWDDVKQDWLDSLERNEEEREEYHSWLDSLKFDIDDEMDYFD